MWVDHWGDRILWFGGHGVELDGVHGVELDGVQGVGLSSLLVGEVTMQGCDRRFALLSKKMKGLSPKCLVNQNDLVYLDQWGSSKFEQLRQKQCLPLQSLRYKYIQEIDAWATHSVAAEEREWERRWDRFLIYYTTSQLCTTNDQSRKRENSDTCESRIVGSHDLARPLDTIMTRNSVYNTLIINYMKM